jgi:hypothetical protein
MIIKLYLLIDRHINYIFLAWFGCIRPQDCTRAR